MRYRKLHGWKYELMEAYAHNVGMRPARLVNHEYILLSLDGILLIKKRYAWDGASGPTIDTKSCLRASLVHDALYQLMSLGLLPQSWRQRADELLRDIAIEDGMWLMRAWTWYYTLRAVGGHYAKFDMKDGDNPVLEI